MSKKNKTKRPLYKRLWFLLIVLFGIPLCMAILASALFTGWNYANLPKVAELKSLELTEPLKIYTRDGELISEIGEVKRTPVSFSEIPLNLQQAFLAAEDARFYEHIGIDYYSLARAISQYLSSSNQQTGASTITMQLARGFYLSNERTLWRKFREILLAIKIERELSKEKIFELYLNKIFLGHKAYGVAAAARTYYNAKLEDLTLAQMATIAALPKAPSSLNPISNPERNLQRRNWILNRMQELGYIDEIATLTATKEPVDASPYKEEVQISANYVTETVRTQLLAPGMLSKEGVTPKFLYNNGIRVYTSIDSMLQKAANNSAFAGLMAYEERHGYKGPFKHFEDFNTEEAEKTEATEATNITSLRNRHPELDDTLADLAQVANYNDRLIAALVLVVTDTAIDVVTSEGTNVNLSFEDGFPFQGKFIDTNRVGKVKNFSTLLQTGDAVYLRRDTNKKNAWVLAQEPSAQMALISVDPSDGAILAMIGGSNFGISQFNRATQAERLIGSNIKPLIYAYGFEHGLSPGSIFVDGPIANNEDWRPQNYGLTFLGPITLRKSLTLSRNLVAIRLLKHLGVKEVANFIEGLGVTSNMQYDLSFALGTATFTPQNIARSMSMFVNGGHLVNATLVEEVEDAQHNSLYTKQNLGVCMRKLVNEPTAAPATKTNNEIEQVNTSTDQINAITTADMIDPQILLEQPTQITLFSTDWLDRYCSEEQAAPPKRLHSTSSYLIYDIMRNVIQQGTATKAKKLKRQDYGGKTGTTNDNIDAWFSGIHPMLVTSIWIGFDAPSTLGRHENGSRAALPIWIDYMQQIQERIPVLTLTRPDDVFTAYIDPTTGERVDSQFPNAQRELFTEDSMPELTSKILIPQGKTNRSTTEQEVLHRPEDIF